MAPGVVSIQEHINKNREYLSAAGNVLRQKFLQWYDESSEQYDKEDVQRLAENDFYCLRFVAHSIGLTMKVDDPSIDMVKSVFKWRKEFGINHFKESEFPEEFKKSDIVYVYRRDKEGNITVMFRTSKYHKDLRKGELGKQHMAYYFDKLDKKFLGQKQLTLILDCRGAGLSNVDLELILFMKDLFMKRFPLLLAHIVIYDMPWILTATWKLIKGWLPSQATERIHFVNKETITEYIDPEDLPEDMGGLDKTTYPLEGKDPMDNLPESLLAEIQALKL